MHRVLIIGGYGNFGRFIAAMLAREADIQVIIAGRNRSKADALAGRLPAVNPIQTAALDIHNSMDAPLQAIKPDIVIHTSGPFQSQDYAVAQACIRHRCHYIDLADGRKFVSGITALNQTAQDNEVLICSGASSVPTLTSAVIDQFLPQFSRIRDLEYAITTAQKTSRGLATTAAVLSYAGKPFTTLIDGRLQPVYGWLDLRTRHFFGLGNRWLGNCDIPDLDLFPQRYPTLENLRFRAGLELKAVHGMLFFISWLVRLKLLRSLQPMARALMDTSRLLDPFGTEDSGFYLQLQGLDHSGAPLQSRFDLVARKGDGLYIPAVPAILMALKLARGEILTRGALPCMGFVTLTEYLAILAEFAIEWRQS